MSVESVDFSTGDRVRLVGELSTAAGRLGVVITHPHPLHGGTMHTPVPTALFEASAEFGVPALRFNFRGVGGSSGEHGGGVTEQRDVLAAIATLQATLPDIRSVLLAGWSFGADVALAVDHANVAGWFAVAPPLAIVAPDTMAAGPSAKPVVIASPQHDQFCPPPTAEQRTAAWTNTAVRDVPGADHFLAGRIHLVVDAFTEFITQLDANPQGV